LTKCASTIKLTKKDTEVIVGIIFQSITDSLSEGEKLELRDFVSFRIRERNARIGRNPKSGEQVEVPAKKVPFFKGGKELRELVDENDLELS
jgi:integration host factor subunit beta